MTENDNLKIALELIEKNKISLAIEKLKKSKNAYSLKILGILLCIYGNFEKAYLIFRKLENKEEKIREYIYFLEGSIKDKYIPKYNSLIELIKKNQNLKEIEKLLNDLEKISPNIELYNIATIFYLNQNNLKMAYNYYIKLIQLDNSFINNDKFKNFFENKQMSKKLKRNHILELFLLGLSLLFIYNNFNLKENLNLKNEESFILENKIKNLQSENKKLTKSNEIILKSSGKNKIIEKESFEEKLFTDNEFYNLVLKRYKQNKYIEVLKICKKIQAIQLPEYKAKEILFIKAMTYEKLSQNDMALKCYREFLKKYDKKEYNDYVKMVKQKIFKLKKEISKNGR